MAPPPEMRVVWNFSRPNACTIQKRQRVTNDTNGSARFQYVKHELKQQAEQVDATGLGDVVTWGQLRDVLCESDSDSDEYSDDSSSDSDGDNGALSSDDVDNTCPTQIE